MTWLSWEYMYGKLDLRMVNKFADDEIVEEEYENYSDRIQNLDLEEIREEYEEYFG